METTENKETFQGFVPPVDDYFRMPNEWINICADINSLAELKIVQYVLRHTWGYQDYDGVRKLTLDEFMHGRKRRDGTRIDRGTGLSDRGVKDGIALAVKHGYLVCEIDDRDRARIKKSYGIRMISELPDRKNLPPKRNSDRKNSPIPDGKNLPADRKNSPSKREDSSQRSEKDTIEKNLKKNSEKERKSPTDLPSLSLSPEEQGFYDLWSQMSFNVIPPKITDILAKHCATLAPHVKTLDQLKRLCDFAREYDHVPADKDIKLGNLVNALNGWLQIQSNAALEQPAQQYRGKDLAAEHRKMVEDMKKRISAERKGDSHGAPFTAKC